MLCLGQLLCSSWHCACNAFAEKLSTTSGGQGKKRPQNNCKTELRSDVLNFDTIFKNTRPEMPMICLQTDFGAVYRLSFDNSSIRMQETTCLSSNRTQNSMSHVGSRHMFQCTQELFDVLLTDTTIRMARERKRHILATNGETCGFLEISRPPHALRENWHGPQMP